MEMGPTVGELNKKSFNNIFVSIAPILSFLMYYHCETLVFLFFKLIFIGVQLLYNVVLVSIVL